MNSPTVSPADTFINPVICVTSTVNLSSHPQLMQDILLTAAEWLEQPFNLLGVSRGIARVINSRAEVYLRHIDWEYISITQNLSEDFITRYADKVDWYWISSKQNLSEDFIARHIDKVHWDNVSRYQILSERFIMVYLYRLSWHLVYRYQNLSEDFIKELSDVISTFQAGPPRMVGGPARPGSRF